MRKHVRFAIICLCVIGAMFLLNYALGQRYEPRPIIRNTNAVSSIRAGYYMGGEWHSAGYPLVPHVQEAVLALLAEEEMQWTAGNVPGLFMIEDVGVEVVFALPNELVTVKIEPERGLVGSSSRHRRIYEILNPTELLEKLLDILEPNDG